MKPFNGAGLSGPYKSEQKFKMDFIEKMTERAMPGTTFFCIESEETEPGFPDVMKIDMHNKVEFFEMKITDSQGRFEFQRTQPRFYRLHPDMPIRVVVWHSVENRAYILTAKEAAETVLRKGRLDLKIGDFKSE